MPLWSRICSLNFLAMFLIFMGACSQVPTEVEAHVIFTASGAVITNIGDGVAGDVIVRSDGEELRLDGEIRMDSICLVFDWVPSRDYMFTVNGQEITATAPQQPALALIGSIAFDDDLLKLKAGVDERGASALAVSPSANMAAVGTDDGDVLLISLIEGRITDRRERPGSYIRSLVFFDENHLAVGEQAPAGSIILYEIESGHLHEDWRFDVGEIIGKGTYDESDPYSWAHQPGVYRLSAGEEGSVYAVATYSPVVDGERRARWTALELDGESGGPLWIYTSDDKMAGVATWFDMDDTGKNMALCVGRDSGDGALVLIDARDGELRAVGSLAPLQPHLTRVSFWRGVAISPGGDIVYGITNDGRAAVWSIGSELSTVELGEPILAGDYPVLISGVGVVGGPTGAYFVTGTTYIPWELSSGEAVPQPHPSANTVFYVDRKGALVWGIPIPNLSQGFVFTKDNDWLLASYASNPAYSPDAGAGLVAIQADTERGRVIATFSVTGTVAFGSPAVDASEHFVMLAENRRRNPDGEVVEGRNQIHLLFW